MISQISIEQLLNTAVIEDVVGEYVNLKRAGSRFKGVCPFHDEKTPSFTVTPTLGIYKCFGCQKGGNSIHFLMEIERLSFTEAARSLARKYGIELIEIGGVSAEEYNENQKLRESISNVLEFAHEFFKKNLFESEPGKTIGLPYYKERGFTLDTIKVWGLGFSPDSWDALYKASLNSGYDPDLLVTAGLLKKKENGDYFDMYRNRVIFPIYSVSGKIIAFAGRKLSSTDPSPKYVNSPETELYKKSDILFGIYQAKNAIKKSDKVFLTEGYTDVITLAQNGIGNVVASSGTALTIGQIKLLRRFSPNITILYDGDSAGVKASMRGINLLLAEDLNVRVVPLPEGEDPDSLCGKLGEKFIDYIAENEKNFIFFKADLLLKEAAADPIKRSEAIRDILDSLSEISDPLKRSSLTRELAVICEMEEQLLSQELAKIVRKKNLNSKQSTELLNEVSVIVESAEQTSTAPKLTDEHQELSLARVILMHGEKPFDEQKTVFDLIAEELSEDLIIQFEEEICKLFFAEIFDSEMAIWKGQKHILHHVDSRLASWAATELSKQHVLSKTFEDNHIYIVQDEENYRLEVVSVLLHLRRKKLESIINYQKQKLETIEDNSELDETLSYIMYLEEFKLKIAKLTNITVSRI